jgi:4-hydroxy-tetrahydrodipicolinate synthase
MWGAQVKPDMEAAPLLHAGGRVDLPLIVFEYPPASGMGFVRDARRALQDPECRGRQSWSSDIVAYEESAGPQGLRRPVAMLSSFTMSLMASFLVGGDGCISAWAVAADLQAEL